MSTIISISKDISTVLQFEGHDLAFLEHKNGELLIRATDLCQPMEVTRTHLLKKCRSLLDSERCVVKGHTFGGEQDILFLTRSGALQVMATGRSEKCRRLRKVICDFFVSYMDGKYGNVRQYQETIQSLTSEVAALRQELSIRPTKALVYNTQRFGKEDLHKLTQKEAVKLQSQGYYTSPAYLEKVTGERQPGGKSGSLTKRTLKHCREKGLEFFRYLKWGRVFTFLPREALAFINSGDVEGQLFLPGYK